MKKRRLAVFAVGGAAVVASVGTATPSMAASSKAPITIAWMTTLVRAIRQPGVNNDIKLATDQINSQGGIDGHKVSFVAYDANLTPQQAVTATQKALGSKPTAFIGYSVDDQIQATAQLLKQSGIPVPGRGPGPGSQLQRRPRPEPVHDGAQPGVRHPGLVDLRVHQIPPQVGGHLPHR